MNTNKIGLGIALLFAQGCVSSQKDGIVVGGPDAGGKGSGSELDIYASGSRLKMRVLTSPDGAKAFHSWFDTATNQECQFGPAADATIRCLPTHTLALFFSDASCQFPVALIASSAPAPKLIGVANNIAYPNDPVTGPRLFSVGPQNNAVYERNVANGQCGGPSVRPGMVGYMTANEVGSDQFVVATLSTE